VYKLLLCWRYLLTRYLALACVVSVMLGVATLIVVNSVMSGFSTKLKDRLHGLLSDVLIESFAQEGFADPQEKMRRIRESPIGDKIEAITPTIEVLGLIQMKYGDIDLPLKPVRILGIDPVGRSAIGGFAERLVNPLNREHPSFALTTAAREWHARHYADLAPRPPDLQSPGQPPRPLFPSEPDDHPQTATVILGYAMAHFRKPNVSADSLEKDLTAVHIGDEIILHTVTGGGQHLVPVYDNLIVVDYFKSEMSEYDSMYVFVPLEWLQRLRNMDNRATALQIKLKDYKDADDVVRHLQDMFPHELNYNVETWKSKQGPLLAAIAIERGILNVLLFLIVGVAGFGILTIFSMIVVEKTRDIGILKALGASNGGVMKIFLSYGLLLGLVGAALGTGLGVSLTVYINEIEGFLTWLTGQEIFPRDVYYFDQIPTDIQFWNVALVDVGAVAIAVLASVLPALRAALLHPVRALRYE
jgi:lipoprotein-releasing system permease protein